MHITWKQKLFVKDCDRSESAWNGLNMLIIADLKLIDFSMFSEHLSLHWDKNDI